MIKQQNVGMEFEYFPSGGELYVQSSMGYETINTTASPAIANATGGTDTTANSATPTPTSEQSTPPFRPTDL